MKKFGPLAIGRLTQIYKASALLGHLPQDWLKIKVIFLPKPGKPDYATPRAFRPISLMSFMMKGLERIQLWRHEETTLQQFPFHSNQHGFRKGHSCETNLTQLTEVVESALQSKQMVLLADLDIKGAYDNLRFKDIMSALQLRGASPIYRRWHQHFLYNTNYYQPQGDKPEKVSHERYTARVHLLTSPLE